MSLAAGDLDRRITIQVGVVTRDKAGDVVTTFADDYDGNFKLFAKKVDRVPVETIGSQQLIRTADTEFTIRTSERARTIFPETHRIAYKGKLYTLVGVTESKDRADALVLLASSRPDGRGARARGNTNGP